MIKFVSLLLRLAIVGLLVLPLIVPTVSSTSPTQASRQVTIVSNRPQQAAERKRAMRLVREHFGSESQISFQNLASTSNHVVQVYDTIGQTVQGLKDLVVLDLDEVLWGEPALRFNQKLRETDAAQTDRLYKLPSPETEDTRENFLFLSDLYVPKVSFLGEETLAVAEISGRLEPGSFETVEILVRSNGQLVTTERSNVTAPSDGVVQSVIEVPVSFIKAQSQVITVEMRSQKALEDYAHASTTVFVAHNKTTVLHVAVGPDWSLRTMRQKLKFWPNLDLLSYYILRERWDDNTIPQSQLSLIEFPAEKLFGEQLANFHGIVSQNFYFDHYLAKKEALNLVNYVQEGGRMFLQAGPLSFLSRDPAFQALFPCEEPPRYTVSDAPERWQAAKGSAIQLPDELASSLPYIQSQTGFKECKPKSNAFVLAELASGEPVLFAQTLGKGLVVSTLAADWHTQGIPLAAAAAGKVPGERSAALMEVHLQTTASERLSTWIVEFLQRRQDSGLRAPDLAGPRLTTSDRFLLTRSRGGVRRDAEVLVRSPDSGAELIAKAIDLPFLGREGLLLPAELGSILPSSGEGRFRSLGLVVTSPGQSEEDVQALLRGGKWPITPPPSRPLPPNPKLLEGITPLDAKLLPNSSSNSAAINRIKTERPLLEVFPWLMALALALLCVDTLLHLVMRPSPTRATGGP